jgi:serine/threonine protein kinase
MGKGVQDLAGLRSWLTSGDGLAPDLAKKLLGLLPSEEASRFGSYRALAHLADGGMGSVWLAHHEDQDELVVVKTMKAGLTNSLDASKGTELLRRFERETAITRQLKHHVHGAGVRGFR